MNTNRIKRIPYGAGDFDSVQLSNDYYVDKTHYIPLLEKTRFAFLIRPRRFGKTLFLSMLYSYYDVNRKDKFEELFRDTWILENSTEERGGYLILYFNFSAVNPDINKVEESFNFHCSKRIDKFIRDYSKFLEKGLVTEILNENEIYKKLEILNSWTLDKHKIYLLIDEYDNFANTIITRYGQNSYEDLTHEEGFFRYFFNVLKSAASGSGSGLARMFITGVSPITTDDVTSGFNIGDNITLQEEYAEILGFTEEDVSKMIDYYTEVGEFKLDKQETMELLSNWYNGYRFTKRTSATLYNTDMILYFMKEVLGKNYFPDNLIDRNIRIDYGKLRYILTVNRQLNGNFDVLEYIISNGVVSTDIIDSFSYLDMLKPENFISLLFYFGLITIKGEEEDTIFLGIPNNTVKEILNTFIYTGYEDAFGVKIDIFKLSAKIKEMGYRGEWEPCINFIARYIAEMIRLRDLINGENSIKALFLSLINIYEYFIPETEKEMSRGYADILLVPFLAKYKNINYGYILEFKYFSPNEYTEEKKSSLIKQASEQLKKYVKDDRLKKIMHAEPYGRIKLKKLIIIFRAYEMVYCEEVS